MAEIKRMTGRCMNREDRFHPPRERQTPRGTKKPFNRITACHVLIPLEPTQTPGHDSGFFLTFILIARLLYKSEKALISF